MELLGSGECCESKGRLLRYTEEKTLSLSSSIFSSYSPNTQPVSQIDRYTISNWCSLPNLVSCPLYPQVWFCNPTLCISIFSTLFICIMYFYKNFILFVFWILFPVSRALFFVLYFVFYLLVFMQIWTLSSFLGI